MNKNLLLWFLLIPLVIALSATGTLLYLKTNEVKYYAEKVSGVEAQARIAYGKLYDLQEKRDDEAFSGEAVLHVKVFEAEKALAECKALQEKK